MRLTDPTATNFDPAAEYDDGSCEFLSAAQRGCCNYNPDALKTTVLAWLMSALAVAGAVLSAVAMIGLRFCNWMAMSSTIAVFAVVQAFQKELAL